MPTKDEANTRRRKFARNALPTAFHIKQHLHHFVASEISPVILRFVKCMQFVIKK